jgi:hypothetical protein
MRRYHWLEGQYGPWGNFQNWSEFNSDNGPRSRERKLLTDSMKLNKADSAWYTCLCMTSNDLPNSSHFIRK